MKTFSDYLKEEGEGVASASVDGGSAVSPLPQSPNFSGIGHDCCSNNITLNDPDCGCVCHKSGTDIHMPMGNGILTRFVGKHKDKRKKKKPLTTLDILSGNALNEAEEESISDKQENLDSQKASIEQMIKNLDSIKNAITNIGEVSEEISGILNDVSDIDKIQWLFDAQEKEAFVEVISSASNALGHFLRGS